MKIWINDENHTERIRPLIREGMQHRADHAPPVEVPGDVNALTLRDASSESEYLETFLRLMRYRDNVDTMPFEIPHRGGWRGRLTAWIKRHLWRLLRYQHDRITFRQNLINSLYTHALEYQRDRHRDDIHRLEERIKKLEEQ